jgi:hypothetical protein
MVKVKPFASANDHSNQSEYFVCFRIGLTTLKVLENGQGFSMLVWTKQ